jgi:hypothetical protein
MNRILRCILRSPGAALLLAPTAWAQAPDEAVVRRLAEYERRQDAAAIDFAWPYLDSPEAAVRTAARRVIEHQPFESWKARALEEKGLWASLEALQALAEVCPPAQAAELSPHLCEHITTLQLEHMDATQQLAAVHLTRLVFLRLGPVSEDERRQMLDLWSNFQPLPPAGEKLRGLLRFLGTVRTRRS